ncbi:hypothetical protein ABMA28_013417 [Loxostege sticticalis]|uniref:DNA-directed DNA polymerase n=1 Tax=Loxostege sticticalis TaxID=481309 RepID=A0ABD0TIB0_LOXSC
MPFCSVCNTSIGSNSWIGHLRSRSHKQNNSSQPHSDGVEIVASAFRSRIISYRIVPSESDQVSLDSFFNSISNKIKSLIDEALKKHTCLKVNFELFSIFMLFKNNMQEMKSFLTKNFVIYQNYDFNSIFFKLQSTLKKKIDEFQESDSGWAFLSNSHLEINVNKYQPLGGCSYLKLPKCIQNKKACLNIHNKDQFCFLWSVTAALYPARSHPERVSSYPNFQDVLNVQGMSFPVTFTDINIFEKNNPKLRFIIYGLKNNKTIIGPLYKSENNENKRTIHLLLLDNGTNSHYCLIKDLSRLLRSQVTAHHGKIYFCDTCLVFFPTCEELESHLCSGIVTVLPEKGSVIKFSNYDRKQNVPFVIYADFETLLQKSENSPSVSDTANTKTLQRHIPAAFAYKIVCSVNDSFNRYVAYRGPDCVKKFIDSIYRDVSEIHTILSENSSMIFTDNDAVDFIQATRCHICHHFLFSDKVRDHCHITGLYRGAAHSHCNLQYKTPKFIPIFFHNLAGYDCHLFIKQLGELPGDIKVIPKTKENYVSFTKFIPVSGNKFIQVRFVDSFKFLGTSLDRLAKTIKKEEFDHLHRHFPIQTQFNLLARKGIYPYEYMDCWERYEERSLPDKNMFYSSLTNEHITDEDYQHAQSVWTQFNIKNLGQYTDLYIKVDVLLLTDIFEKFRKTCKLHYQLDPAFYVTAPSLSFDAMLLKTGVELELIDDHTMVRMIQSGIRGGVCMCSHRHAKANNKYMPDYDAQEPDTYVVYIDCNNLYGYSMCHSLPLSNFRFLNQTEIDKLDVASIPDDAEYGYILEVDLSYPKELHHKHNDLPFCPEKCIPPGGKNSKLVPNLYDKYFYVIHYVHLKTCIKHGLLLKKIHRAIIFRQSPYLKQYIDLNTHLRQKAQSAFEQDFFKLLNNSIFGKTLENNEKRVNVHLVNEWSDQRNKTKKRYCADKLIASSNFHSASVFTENLVAIQSKPDRVILDKPIYIGFTVLELSKSHMYDFHYSVFEPSYKNRLRMCYTDTDSFIYQIETKDFYKDLKQLFLNYFDTSNYPVQNVYGLPLLNKKVPGLFKDEMSGNIITEFVGLRSKLYCIKTVDSTIKKAKGVKTCVVRNITLSDYKKSLYYGDIVRRTNVLFKSIKHDIYTRSVNKVALSCNDDKRHVLADKVSTRAWGHASILNI